MDRYSIAKTGEPPIGGSYRKRVKKQNSRLVTNKWNTSYKMVGNTIPVIWSMDPFRALPTKPDT